MNETEQYILDTIYKRKGIPVPPLLKDSAFIQYYVQGNFTVCIINDGTVSVAGVTKRHPLDRYDSNIGWKLAFRNAVHELVRQSIPKATRSIKTYVLAENFDI